MRAELVGDDTVSCAGITAPVPELCRALLKAGHDGGERLLVYHDGELEFVVPTIAGAAGIKAANSAPGESATVLPFAQFAGGKRKRRGDGGGDAA
jgi:hypothetical protein